MNNSIKLAFIATTFSLLAACGDVRQSSESKDIISLNPNPEHNGHYSVSFYTLSGDCSDEAAPFVIYGGGGHKNAAGWEQVL